PDLPVHAPAPSRHLPLLIHDALPIVLPWNPPQTPTPSALPVAARLSRRAASTASAPPENIWMRVRPSGVTEASSSRNLARVSVVKLPKVRRETCRLRAST